MTNAPLYVQIFAGFLGAISIAILFGVPKRYYLACGIIGATGWFLYCILVNTGLTDTERIFFSTVLVALLSRFAAVWLECPVTIFQATGLIPLIPGGGIYWTTYYLVLGNTEKGLSAGFGALKTVFAIVFGIILVFELPNSLFNFVKKFKKKNA